MCPLVGSALPPMFINCFKCTQEVYILDHFFHPHFLCDIKLPFLVFLTPRQPLTECSDAALTALSSSIANSINKFYFNIECIQLQEDTIPSTAQLDVGYKAQLMKRMLVPQDLNFLKKCSLKDAYSLRWSVSLESCMLPR